MLLEISLLSHVSVIKIMSGLVSFIKTVRWSNLLKILRAFVYMIFSVSGSVSVLCCWVEKDWLSEYRVDQILQNLIYR